MMIVTDAQGRHTLHAIVVATEGAVIVVRFIRLIREGCNKNKMIIVVITIAIITTW